MNVLKDTKSCQKFSVWQWKFRMQWKQWCIDLFRFYTRAITRNVWKPAAGIYYPSESITQLPAMQSSLISNAIHWSANSTVIIFHIYLCCKHQLEDFHSSPIFNLAKMWKLLLSTLLHIYGARPIWFGHTCPSIVGLFNISFGFPVLNVTDISFSKG